VFMNHVAYRDKKVVGVFCAFSCAASTIIMGRAGGEKVGRKTLWEEPQSPEYSFEWTEAETAATTLPTSPGLQEATSSNLSDSKGVDEDSAADTKQLSPQILGDREQHHHTLSDVQDIAKVSCAVDSVVQ
jgi:hypothetical protein